MSVASDAGARTQCPPVHRGPDDRLARRLLADAPTTDRDEGRAAGRHGLDATDRAIHHDGHGRLRSRSDPPAPRSARAWRPCRARPRYRAPTRLRDRPRPEVEHLPPAVDGGDAHPGPVAAARGERDPATIRRHLERGRRPVRPDRQPGRQRHGLARPGIETPGCRRSRTPGRHREPCGGRQLGTGRCRVPGVARVRERGHHAQLRPLPIDDHVGDRSPAGDQAGS